MSKVLSKREFMLARLVDVFKEPSLEIFIRAHRALNLSGGIEDAKYDHRKYGDDGHIPSYVEAFYNTEIGPMPKPE